MSTLKQYQADIARRMRRGDTFASVEGEVIDPSGLTDAEKSALWLYGWSFVNRRGQRREAVAHLTRLDPGEEATDRAPRRLGFARFSLAR